MIHTPIPGIIQRNQKIQMCGPTIFLMAAERRGIIYPLEEIAEMIGAYIDERDKEQFMEGMQQRALDKNDPRVGFLIDNFKDARFQKRIKTELGLETEVFHPSNIYNTDNFQENLNTVSNFITDNLDAGYDLAMNFHWKPIKGFGQWPLCHDCSL